jgi:hypothetical protein
MPDLGVGRFEVQAAADPRSTPRNAGEKNGVRVFAPYRYRYVGLTLAKAVVAWPGARGAEYQAGRWSPVNPHISRPDRFPRNPDCFGRRSQSHPTPTNYKGRLCAKKEV